MGDRVSIAFRTGKEESVTLFNHWGGREFSDVALQYATELKAEMTRKDPKGVYPMARLEPCVVMVDFIRWLWTDSGIGKGHTFNDKSQYVETGRSNDSLYLGKDENDGDNSDNGHWIVDLEHLKLIHNKGRYESDETD